MEAREPLNVPAAQFVQGFDPPGEYVPGVQSMHENWPVAFVKEPPGQSAHADEDVAPGFGENVPTLHAVHVEPPAKE